MNTKIVALLLVGILVLTVLPACSTSIADSEDGSNSEPAAQADNSDRSKDDDNTETKDRQPPSLPE